LSYFRDMDSCMLKACVESPSTLLHRCDGCGKHGIHLNCFESVLKARSSYGDTFVFCCIACVDTGPLILAPDVSKAAGKLNKAQLKAYLRSKELRVVDDQGKDLSKSELIDTLVVFSNTFIDSSDEYSRLRSTKTPNCDFRLLNVLFHNDFAEKFQATGASMSREELDAQNGASAVNFWDEVAEAYNDTNNNLYDDLLFDSPKFSGICPRLFVKHNATKLQMMWKKMNKLYSKAQRKYQKSGTHDPDFASVIPEDEEDDFENFTDYAAVFYLRKHLEQKPGLNEFVVRKLDDSISMESDDLSKFEQRRRDSDLSSTSSSGQKKKRKKDDLSEALFRLSDNKDRNELLEKKFEVMLRKEDRMIEKNEREKQKMDNDIKKINFQMEKNERAKKKLEHNRKKMEHDIGRSDLADTIQRQKMKVEYLETLCQGVTHSSSEHTKYSEQLEEARERYLNLLS
jgi:hypothetical protein